MPDADLDQAADALIGAGYGSAGERCMAISVAVAVGDVGDDRERAGAARLSPQVSSCASTRRADMGPLVTASIASGAGLHRQRRQRGRELLVDGRGFALPGHEQGFFLGGSLFDA